MLVVGVFTLIMMSDLLVCCELSGQYSIWLFIFSFGISGSNCEVSGISSVCMCLSLLLTDLTEVGRTIFKVDFTALP